MSMRTLIEINHDYCDRKGDEFLPALRRYLASGRRDDAERLERFGVRVVGMRHHADKYIIDSRADGFPPRYLEPPSQQALSRRTTEGRSEPEAPHTQDSSEGKS